MLSKAYLDVAGGGLFLGIFALAIFIGAVTILEGFILKFLKWKPSNHPFTDAFVMNVVSTIAGAIVFAGDQDLDVRWFIITWIITMMVEVTTIAIFRKASPKTCIAPLTIANLASYLALFGWAYFSGWIF